MREPKVSIPHETVPEVVGTAKAAAWLGLSEEQVRRLCREGRLEGAFQPSGYLGKWLIPRSTLERARSTRARNDRNDPVAPAPHYPSDMAPKADLKAAEADLADLAAELPNFEALLHDNEAEAAQLREQKAAPAEQAAARGRVNVARELLEQHHADLAATRERIGELQAQLAREADLKRLKALDDELVAAHGPWVERAVQVCNSFIDDTKQLARERSALQEKSEEADRLRSHLGLHVEKPELLRNYPPYVWRLEYFAEPSVSAGVPKLFDRLPNGTVEPVKLKGAP